MLKSAIFLLLTTTFLFGNDWVKVSNSVIDTKHHLRWQDTPDIQENENIWKMQKTHCKGLHLSGFNDWRLPTKDELLILANSSEAKKLFSHLNSALFWSINGDPKDDMNAFTIYMPNGHISTSDKCEKNSSLCVRSE
ncbi:DUF1566 domain-containing protein [bacterium]|nr:DUF1566 domain-containing protein [bacterium]MBU1883399.1 DUF1566 domain-containing protein [bacterium]